MPRVDQRGSSALLYLVAVVMIGGFMYWLYMQTQSMEQNVQPQTNQDTAAAQGPLAFDSLSADTEAAIGRRAVLDSIQVATGLGRGVFLIQIDSTRSMPVLKNPSLIQRGDQLYGGDQVTVAGQVYTYTDSIGQAWVQRGAVNKSQAGSLPSDSLTNAFLLADSLVLH